MNQKTFNIDRPVSEIVRSDYRTADVFKKHGINYCCGGNASLKDACDIKQIDLTQISGELNNAVQSIHLPAAIRFDEWPVAFLIDYILNVHHAYIKQTLGPLLALLKSFAEGHKGKYPYMMDVLDAFEGLHDELKENIKEQEETVFPYLRQICSTHTRRESYGNLFVRTLSKPLNKTSGQRRLEVYLKTIRELTNHYTFTPSVCTNHQVIYHKLREFDTDLVQHKHLENNILFPKVVQMEQELLQQ
jgi:regulator of cell morphogenesis and NO signaling